MVVCSRRKKLAPEPVETIPAPKKFAEEEGVVGKVESVDCGSHRYKHKVAPTTKENGAATFVQVET